MYGKIPPRVWPSDGQEPLKEDIDAEEKEPITRKKAAPDWGATKGPKVSSFPWY